MGSIRALFRRSRDAGDTAADFDERLRGGALVAVGLAWLASGVFAGAIGRSWAHFFQIFGAAVIISAAAASIGGLLGFLFGIPRTLQREALASDDASTRYLANTNLEQISDWLTKILVGISLVQIGKAVPAMASLADSLRPMLGNKPDSGGFGLALAIYSTVATFLVGYLWTRVGLKRQLQIADEDLKSTVAAAIDSRSADDATVLSLLERQLSGQNPPTQAELNEAFQKASPVVLTQAYQRAESQRKDSWRSVDDASRRRHERTIPIFRALIAADTTDQYHRQYGSLGYALKDVQEPQYGEARDMLGKAIAIRDKNGAPGFHFYEWNRAVCAIHLDPAFSRNEASSTEQRTVIEGDLRAAAKHLGDTMFIAGAQADQHTQVVTSWLALNALSLAQLKTS